jgi:succinate dehydrogenase/fumarate reductase flavoprotein subunit
MRSLETLNVLTCAQIVVQACQARRASSKPLSFLRADYPDLDPPEWRKWLLISLAEGRAATAELPLDYYGDLTANYERHNRTYLKGGK